MSTTTFSDGVTLTAASWFNDVDTATYMTLSGVSGTNTITATGPKNATLSTNLRVVFVPANTNTGATTINITPSGGAALTAKNVFCNGIACVGGEIKQNVPVMLHYDGTQFNILGPFTAGTIPGNVVVSGTLAASSTFSAVPGGTSHFNVAAGRVYVGGNSSQLALALGYNKTRTDAAQTPFIGASDSATPDLLFYNSSATLLATFANSGGIGFGNGGANPHIGVSVVGSGIGYSGGYSYGVTSSPTWASGSATSGLIAYDSYVVLSGSSVVPSVTQFQANTGSLGTATVSNFYGFSFAQTSLSGATNVYAYNSSLNASGGTRWAFYGGGTAPSHFGGNVDVTGTFVSTGAVSATGGGYPSATTSTVSMIGGGNPAVAFSSSNATANSSKWDLYADSSTQFHGRAIKDDNTGANDWIRVTRSGFTISSVEFPNGAVNFTGVGTTASAANAYLDNAASNNLLRSTSSIRYKQNVETLSEQYSSGIYKFRPVWYRSKAQADRKDWGFYGLIAEEVAEIDPRLVHWTHRDTKEVLVSEATETEEAQYQTVIDKDSPLIPDGVQYERISVLLLAEVQKLRSEFDSYKASHP
jgi:hypothetical protein